MTDLQHAREALFSIPAGSPRDPWFRALAGWKDLGGDEDTAREWSALGDNFDAANFRDTWRSIKPGRGIGAGTLFELAKQHGYVSPGNGHTGGRNGAKEPRKQRAEGLTPAQLLARFTPAPADHLYIVSKQGLPDNLSVVPEGDPLQIMGESMAGALVLPVTKDGEVRSLQFITPPETAQRLKARGKPGKLNLPGHSVDGWFCPVGEIADGCTIYIVEGIGQAWAAWKATGQPAVVTFGAGRMRAVTRDLKECFPQSHLVLVPDSGKEEQAEQIATEFGARWVAMPAGWPPNSDINDLAQRDGFDVLEMLLATAQATGKEESKPLPPFNLVPIADLAHAEIAPPSYAWEGLIPVGHVTVLAAHGGVGKTIVALMLAVSVALGRPLFGIPTRRGIAAFYSGEDGAHMLRYRLRLVCRAMGVSIEELQDRLFILDATIFDPTLFAEITTGGRREGRTTAAYDALREFLQQHEVSFLAIDNASDAFDASEIERAKVRGFMRALALLARERDAGLLLLAHVDKGTSRKERAGTEGYSGSTAWHNSARSRLFMTRESDGSILLEHQKHNLGRLREPLTLTWPEGGIPQVDEPLGQVVQGIADRGHERTLLKLIAEFSSRGEYVSTATNSRSHAGKVLRGEPTFPDRLKDQEVFTLLRKAERAGYLQRTTYKGEDRKARERWDVSDAGRAFAGLPAAGAAGAASPEVTAVAQSPHAAAASAATSPLGGMGEEERTEVAAEVQEGTPT